MSASVKIEELPDDYVEPIVNSNNHNNDNTPHTSNVNNISNDTILHDRTTDNTNNNNVQSSSNNSINTLQSILNSDDKVDQSTDKALEYKKQGNIYFAQQQFQQAIEQYNQAILYSPTDDTDNLSIYYNNRCACYLQLKQYEQCINDATESLKLQPHNTKALIRRSLAYEKQTKYNDAFNDIKQAVEIEPSNKQLQSDLNKLQKLNDEQLEQQKNEMLGKLKGLGNTILGKFGMSLDNFQAVKDPNTGSYSISMKQNKS